MAQKIFILMTALLSFLVASGDRAQAAVSCPVCQYDFVIYDPVLGDSDGVWTTETQALTKMFNLFGFRYRIVNADFIKQGRLGLGSKRIARALVMPGGYAVARTTALGWQGKKAIEDFVSNGGNYIGFCAGSFYGTQTTIWAEQSTDYVSYTGLPRPALFNGAAYGPLGWRPWNNATLPPSWELTAVNTTVPALQALGAPAVTRMMYFGGPFFTFATTPPNLEIWTRAIAPAGLTGVNATGANQPTTVRFSKGLGKVILFSYHPVFVLQGMINGVRVQPLLWTSSVYTNPSPLTAESVNYWSWNILYAALRLSADQTVVPLPVQRIQ